MLGQADGRWEAFRCLRACAASGKGAPGYGQRSPCNLELQVAEQLKWIVMNLTAHTNSSTLLDRGPAQMRRVPNPLAEQDLRN